ncbi:MAG: adenylyltransferase/cytidyltransferase family protein [Candidatus Aenigmatarchaeota archaeon]
MSGDAKKPVVVAVSGYFDPLHVGHVEYFEKAKALGDRLVVIVNNDAQAKLKKGFCFMPQDERVKIIKALRCVDEVFLSIDKDKSVCKSLEAVKPDIFAKGGDRIEANLPEPEIEICKKMGTKIVYNLGEKIQSSSELIARIIMLAKKEEKLQKIGASSQKAA